MFVPGPKFWREGPLGERYSSGVSMSINEPGTGSGFGCGLPILATGRELWDASLIYTPTLVPASEKDFWSRPVDREKLQEHLVHAPLRIVVIPGATHFVHLDREERGRKTLIEESAEVCREMNLHHEEPEATRDDCR